MARSRFGPYDVEWQDKIKFNTAIIKNLKPEGINQEAFAFIKEQPTSLYFFSILEISGDADALRTFEEFESKFGESAYGEYASFQLGKFYFFQEEFTKAKDLDVSSPLPLRYRVLAGKFFRLRY